MHRVALITKHQKARWIAPYLAPLGYEVFESSLFDTDTLGTFSGEVERTLSPMDAALTKAKKACELTGTDWGLGSEGSFGGGPAPGMINWNDELLCLYQASTGITVYAHAAGPTSVQELTMDDGVPKKVPLRQKLLLLPKQRWILRTEQRIQKGLSAEQLLTCLEPLVSSTQKLTIEPDLRAMNCPQRQQMITKAAEDLVRRLSETCPQCQAFNFVIKEKQSGLPCTLCTLPTKQAKAWTRVCDTCNYRNDEVVQQKSADPTHCQFCNP
jgi:Zn finger protein HypA/HybF involved in hydrogenase expression